MLVPSKIASRKSRKGAVGKRPGAVKVRLPNPLKRGKSKRV